MSTNDWFPDFEALNAINGKTIAVRGPFDSRVGDESLICEICNQRVDKCVGLVVLAGTQEEPRIVGVISCMSSCLSYILPTNWYVSVIGRKVRPLDDLAQVTNDFFVTATGIQPTDEIFQRIQRGWPPTLREEVIRRTTRIDPRSFGEEPLSDAEKRDIDEEIAKYGVKAAEEKKLHVTGVEFKDGKFGEPFDVDTSGIKTEVGKHSGVTIAHVDVDRDFLREATSYEEEALEKLDSDLAKIEFEEYTTLDEEDLPF